MSDKTQMAQALMSEPGLEQPPEMNLLAALNALASGMSIGQGAGHLGMALAEKGFPALQGLGEAGAIFPEPGASLPPGFTKAEMFTPAERAYKTYENNEKLYLLNDDFQNALKAKWGMLKNAGGN